MKRPSFMVIWRRKSASRGSGVDVGPAKGRAREVWELVDLAMAMREGTVTAAHASALCLGAIKLYDS